MTPATKSLKYIYTAKQCVDVNDCNIALGQIKKLSEHCKKIHCGDTNGYTTAMWYRRLAIERKLKKLTK